MTSERRMTTDEKTLALVDKIHQLIGQHIDNFEEGETRDCVVSTITALSIECGRLKWWATKAMGVNPDSYDKSFANTADKHYRVNKEKDQ